METGNDLTSSGQVQSRHWGMVNAVEKAVTVAVTEHTGPDLAIDSYSSVYYLEHTSGAADDNSEQHAHCVPSAARAWNGGACSIRTRVWTSTKTRSTL